MSISNPADPIENLMTVLVEGFKRTTQAIQDLRDEQAKLQQQQKETVMTAYNGMTGSGKSRYVAKLVEIERSKEEKGAQARVAEMLNVTPGRISQLLNSDKNRRNGK